MQLSCRSMAKFDAVVANVRRALSYLYEGLLLPPPRWEDEAQLYGKDKQLVVLAGVDEEVIRDSPYQQVVLRDFVVVGQDADWPLSDSESRTFAQSVLLADAAFERDYQKGEWHPQVARLIVEVKLAVPVADNQATLRDLLSPLRDALEATLILPSWPEPIDLETVDPLDRAFVLEMSLFLAAELQLPQPLQEQDAVRRIRQYFPLCPTSLIGTKIRLSRSGTSQHSISFRVRQF